MRRLQKNKQRKRQLQLQKNFSQEANAYNDEDNSSNSQPRVILAEQTTAGEDSSALTRRRRKRREHPAISINANVNNSQTILLVQEEIDKIKSKSKDLIRTNNAQQHPDEETAAQNSEKASDNTEKTSEVAVTTAAEITTQVEKNNSSMTRMPSSLQKRVSFILTSNSPQEDSKTLGNVQVENQLNSGDNQNSIEMSRRILKSRQLSSSSAARNSLQAKVFGENSNSSQITKPVLLSNYKIQSAHKLPQKLDSLVTSSELVSNDINNTNNSYVNLTNSSNLLNDTNDGGVYSQQRPDYSATIPIHHQSLLSKRNSASRARVSQPGSLVTPATTPTSTAMTRLAAGGGKAHSQVGAGGYSSSNATSTTTIESMQRYSASRLNKPLSLSTQDLAPPSSSSKQLRLPPVNNSVIIGGSANNLTTIGLSETVPKKKIKDLSHYCYFCQRKTGLASSYTCRLVI